MATRAKNKHFKRLGVNVKDARTELGISQYKLAAIADIDRSYISQLGKWLGQSYFLITTEPS